MEFLDPRDRILKIDARQLMLLLVTFIAGCKHANPASTYSRVEDVARDAYDQVHAIMDLLEEDERDGKDETED